MIETAFQVLGILTGGALSVAAVVGIAWATFKMLSQKWLENQFAKALAAHQHDLDRRLELVRSQFAALLDRAIKLHAKEFETVPEAWRLLCASLGSTGRLLGTLQHHNDVSHLSALKLAKVLDGHDLDEEDRASIENTGGRDRQKIYTRMVDFERFFEASEDHRHFNNFLVISGIFIEPAMLEKFRAVSDKIRDALLVYRIYKVEADGHENWKKLHEANKELQTVVALQDAIQAEINNRLWAVIEEPKD